MSLVAIGLADAVLTGTPVGTFWHFQHKSYTNFSMEVNRNSFNSGVAQFGSSPKYNVDRVGDLVYFIYIEALIPGLGLQFPKGNQAVSILKNSDGNNANAEPYWTKDVGHAMIEKAQVFIGGQCIDEVFSEFMYIWEEISGQPGKHLIEMTGNYNSQLTLQIASRQPRVLYIPLPFWFTQNSGNALPIVSLQFHSVQLQVYFRPLQSLLKLPWVAMNNPGNVLGAGNSYAIGDIMLRPKFVPTASTSVQPVGELTALTSASLTANILITYVYLDQRERSQFADGQFETLINQHQSQSATASQTVSVLHNYGSSDVPVSLDLNFNHPVYEFYIVARLANHNACTNNCLDAQFNEWFNFCGPDDTITEAPIDPLVTIQLKLNNANRFPDLLEARYYRLVEPWQWHTNIVQTNCIYTYSMSLQPEDVQPAGSTNFSRIDNAKLYLVVDRRCFVGPNNPLVAPSPANPSPNSSVDLLVFVQNWNILRFKYGLGGLRFAA
jgi:hypothetical protein